MSRIDFSQTITAEAKMAEAAAARALLAKAECRRRILAKFPFEAQQNIAQAVTVYATEIVRGVTEAEAETAAGVGSADLPLAVAGRRWIVDMQMACRAISKDPVSDPTKDAVWPPLPDEVAGLVARF